jgi:hypothetical protein
MRRSLMIAGLFLLAATASAEERAPVNTSAAGRYAIQSSDGGFVRLDTETGAVSHCRQSNGTWHCDALVQDHGALQDQVRALSARVDDLTAAVGSLKGEIAALKAATPPESKLTPEEERELDKAMGLAERLMKRFFDMVRDLKSEEKQSI